MCKRSASITVAGLALGGLLLAGSPAGAQTVSAPYNQRLEWAYQPRINTGVSGQTTGGSTAQTPPPQTPRPLAPPAPAPLPLAPPATGYTRARLAGK